MFTEILNMPKLGKDGQSNLKVEVYATQVRVNFSAFTPCVTTAGQLTLHFGQNTDFSDEEVLKTLTLRLFSIFADSLDSNELFMVQESVKVLITTEFSIGVKADACESNSES